MRTLVDTREERPGEGSGVLPGDFARSLQHWFEDAGRQRGVVAIVLFGSRAKGCEREWSDWDLALIHGGETEPQIEGLPTERDGREVNWLCKSLRELDLKRNKGGTVESAIAEQGLRVCGEIELGTGEIEMDIHMAFDRFDKALRQARFAVEDLCEHYFYRAETGFSKNLCASSCNAAEFLAKAVAHLRGFNPTKTHDVNALCAELQDHNPGDHLVPVLLRLNGVTHKGHVKGAYDERGGMVESLSKSEARLVAVMEAFQDVLEEAEKACRGDSAHRADFIKGMADLRQAAESRYWRRAVADLAESECPGAVRAGIEMGLSRIVEFGNRRLAGTA